MTYSKLERAWVWILLTVICLALTPAMFAYADAERGYDATGGEIFFPLLPLVLWLIIHSVKDLFKGIKRDWLETHQYHTNGENSVEHTSTQRVSNTEVPQNIEKAPYSKAFSKTEFIIPRKR